MTTVRAIGGDVPLLGTLVWREQALGWTAEWLLTHESELFLMRVTDVSFDVAFRSALEGAAQVLSGNGKPQ